MVVSSAGTYSRPLSPSTGSQTYTRLGLYVRSFRTSLATVLSMEADPMYPVSRCVYPSSRPFCSRPSTRLWSCSPVMTSPFQQPYPVWLENCTERIGSTSKPWSWRGNTAHLLPTYPDTTCDCIVRARPVLDETFICDPSPEQVADATATLVFVDDGCRRRWGRSDLDVARPPRGRLNTRGPPSPRDTCTSTIVVALKRDPPARRTSGWGSSGLPKRPVENFGLSGFGHEKGWRGTEPAGTPLRPP
mmetsp:Transcript_2656/g.11323  ORF Transcript_2656/g.11323 Transcript_2656/m.11323 type:complete len:246 (+) Transcript_2656:592-1329(+)